MKIKELNKIFETYIDNHLIPDEEERSWISDRYNELSKILEGESFQTGSCARFTHIPPVNDLDVIWVLPEEKHKELKKISPETLNPERILSDLSMRLKEEYKNKQDVEINAQTHSVEINFQKKNFSIDVVPAKPLEEKSECKDKPLFEVPEILLHSKSVRKSFYEKEKQIEWIKTDPWGYIREAEEFYKANSSFRYCSRLLKAWKYCIYNHHYEKLSIRSFHVEEIVKEVIKEEGLPDGTFRIIRYIFENLIEEYLKSPKFKDKADSKRYIDSYVEDLTEGELNEIKLYQNSAKILLEKILNAENKNSVKKLIERLLSREEFIEGYGIKRHNNSEYFLKIDGRFAIDTDTGKRSASLRQNNEIIKKGKEIKFGIKEKDLPKDCDLKWKVKNRGQEAKENKCLRGEISDDVTSQDPEKARYLGVHYVECYAIAGNKCIAHDRIKVKIVD